MRKVKRFVVAAVAGVALAVAPVVAAQASPWEFAGSYETEAECESAGTAGVGTDWAEYRCVLFEGVHDLYVR